MWEALDPTKSKLDQEIDGRVRSRSPKQKEEKVERPTSESEGYKTYKSAMANPLLRDQPTRKWTAQDQDDLADHLKHRKLGEENPLTNLSSSERGLCRRSILRRTISSQKK